MDVVFVEGIRSKWVRNDLIDAISGLAVGTFTVSGCCFVEGIRFECEGRVSFGLGFYETRILNKTTCVFRHLNHRDTRTWWH